MVKIGLNVEMAAVKPALPRNARRPPQPIRCGKVQPRKPEGPCVALFKIKPQVYGSEQHAQR